MDDKVLEYLAKNHTRADFERALQLCREAGIYLAPTFVPFTPWTTLPGYLDLLRTLVRLRLVEAVPPIQLCIRLLVPEGSYLLQLAGFPRRDRGIRCEFARLSVAARRPARGRIAAGGASPGRARRSQAGWARSDMFEHIWRLAHDALGVAPPPLARADFGEPIAHLSEPWYCCAEPTDQQLQSF